MQIDVQGLYSMDVQEVVRPTADLFVATKIVDACCGIGGAAIAFARAGKEVIAVDTDELRIGMARENAVLFGVADQIQFLHADLREVIPSISDAAIYLDPPWGGPEYSKKDVFLLEYFNPPGRFLLELALNHSTEVAIKLPRNFDFSQLDDFPVTIRIIENKLHERVEYHTAILNR